jgi:hypothetical protein
MRGVEAFAIPRISAMSPTSWRNHAAGFVMGIGLFNAVR